MNAAGFKQTVSFMVCSVAILATQAGYAQVPVIDGVRENIQQQTKNWYNRYTEDMRKLRGGSGGVTDSFAPGQGSGSPDACSDAGMGGDSTVTGNSNVPQSRQEVADMVKRIAQEEAVDPNFALALAQQESRFNQNARSPVGAIGVMQLMPGTAQELGVNPYNTEGNIRGGIRYLKQNLNKFGGRLDLTAAAYNAGSNRQSLREGRIPNIPETQDYVQKVSANFKSFKAKDGDLGPGGSEIAQTVVGNGFGGCGEQLKKAWDRNTEAQRARGQVINDLVRKSLEANQKYNQASLEGVRSMSNSVKGAGSGGQNPGFGAMTPLEIQCPSGVLSLGSTRCYAMPTAMTNDQVREWLAQLQSQAQANNGVATFDVQHGDTGGLVAIVETRPQD
ncbi:lytic transglycosylase domain-containing protein [Phyllobacterium sophorae]|uniref:Lytic transglycosylase domain-containing protein n=1 Tax=Phyllobacterium sophorae TaxID=1520277 RepID=A0A2P7B368_9HYPH|nr:lytic transglycosylase domain-containing protein [Phyllobacterium sophorae]PSH60912.1 lytic transglycosylase domain-containing protein [Phyllobacterium sophorae]